MLLYASVMSMKSKIKKILTAVLAFAATASFTIMPVFAQNDVIINGTWVGSDADGANSAIGTVKQIKVTNVKDASDNLKVTAYQLAKGVYKDSKLTGYVLCDPENADIKDLEKPTVAEITKIADAVRADTTKLKGIKMTRGTAPATLNEYTANVEAGLYIVLATSQTAYVYNPAVVAVNVTDANNIADTAVGSEVDLSAYWNFPRNAYLKSSITSFNKDIVRSNTHTFKDPEDSEGDIVAIGDLVYFQLDSMTVPTYTDEYAKPNEQGVGGVIYRIDDKLDVNSFAGINNLTVKMVVGDTKTVVDPTYIDNKGTPEDTSDDKTVTNYTVVYMDKDGTKVTDENIGKTAVSYTITFSDAWIRANAEKGVVVTYDSVLTEAAKLNYEANKTTATLSYTVDPSDNTGVAVLRDSTYHYTFALGSKIDGGGSKVKVGNDGDEIDPFDAFEINKVTEALEQGANYTYDSTKKEYSSSHALDGAEFTLYDDAAFTVPHKMWSRNPRTGEWESTNAVYITTENGHIVFKGLDVGVYYLKETAAPDGYTLNANEYQVTIIGTISDGTTAEEGTLLSYRVTTKVKGTDGNYTDVVGDSLFTAVPTVTVGEQTNHDVVTNVVTLNAVPAEVVDTELAALPSTGGAGIIAITIIAATGMVFFLTLFLFTLRKKRTEKNKND